MPTNLAVAPYVGLGLISLVVTLMLFPFAGVRDYPAYKRPLFVAGVAFMPLFVYLSAVLGSDLSLHDRSVLLIAGMAGFFASASWLASRHTQGDYVPGLTVAGGKMAFRPDLMLPGGILFVKGVILTGVGFMLMVQPAWRLPSWNWWGFALAFAGIITLIPGRGVYKMLRRRARFLGAPARYDLAKSGLLIVGLGLLLYGFLSVFMGRTPLADFRPHARLAPEAGLLIGSGALVMLGREALKRRLPEGVESFGALLGKQLLLYAATAGFVYGFVTLFMGAWVRPHPGDNPWGFWMGASFIGAGAAAILVLRPFALRNELAGTVRVMVGTLADAAEADRAELMGRRMRVIADYPLPQRARHVALMNAGVARLDPGRRQLIDAARVASLAALEPDARRRLMEAMDVVMAPPASTDRHRPDPVAAVS